MSGPADIRAEVEELLPGCCERDVLLSTLSTWRIGGPADLVCRPENEDELRRLLELLADAGAAWWIVGRGSNLLFPDRGLRGVVIRLGRGFDFVERRGLELRAGAAASAGSLCRTAAREGLSGLEFAAGIPATLGGMLKMNAGAHDCEIADCVSRVRMLDREARVFEMGTEALGFDYRSCAGLEDSVALEARLRLEASDPGAVAERMKGMLEARRRTQPLDEASCGSVFKRPPGDYPGRLIESAGLKGARSGGLRVSSLHANFFINEGGATASDALELVAWVKQEVLRRTGVRLEEEFTYVR